MRSTSDPDPRRSAAREVASEIGSGVRLAAQPVVDDAISTISMLVLLVLLVPIGILGLIVSFLLLGLIISTVGLPSGALGSAISVSWFVGTLVALAFIFRKLYRRMPRRLRAAYAAPMERATPASPVTLTASVPLTAPTTATAPITPTPPAPTLAELDARLAPEPGSPPST